MMGERRCPTCGALASPEAEWCGQCFAPLDRVGARNEAEAEGAAGPSPVGDRGPEGDPRHGGWAFGALLVVLGSRFGKGGLGPSFPLFVLFLGASLMIYIVSALDAYRVAAGR